MPVHEHHCTKTGHSSGHTNYKYLISNPIFFGIFLAGFAACIIGESFTASPLKHIKLNNSCMKRTRFFSLLLTTLLISLCAQAQYIERVSFDAKDSANGFYLAVPPRSKDIKGVLVVLSNFYQLDDLVPETKLHNVAYANDLLTVFVSLQLHLYADSTTVGRINTVLQHVVTKYHADTTKFVLAGYDYASNIALRYTELTQQYPAAYPLQPRAVFTVSGPVDLVGLWHWCERFVKRNDSPGQQGDAGYLLDYMARENGTLYNNPGRYKSLTPFNREDTLAGNEAFLQKVPVRMYYDTDIAWWLNEKHNSLFDMHMADATALLNRLQLSGNKEASFIAAKQPGKRINGSRYGDAFSIVDETECIQWIKKQLGIFDPVNYEPPYKLAIPQHWAVERFGFPIAFAPKIPYKGVEDVRFAPGWGDSSSVEHWTYAFLWWLHGQPAIDAAALNTSLTDYYNGLVARNIAPRKIPASKVIPTVTDIKKIKTAPGDAGTYAGTIGMLNYLVQRPMVLNCVIHLKAYNAKQRTALFFEVSPQPLQHPVWQQMNQLWSDFHVE